MRADDIDALIGKFLAGEASPEEAMLLEDWKAESQANAAYYVSCEQILGLPQIIPSASTAWDKVRPQLKAVNEVPVRKLNTCVFYRIAAAVVVLIGIGVMVSYFTQTEVVFGQVFTALGVKKRIDLADGTNVVIAKHSSIKLTKEYGKRNRSVDLKGSGYFTVDHNEKLPFIVNTGPIHIKDLGTKFDVNTTKDTIFIRVDEGEVLIYDNNGTRLTLRANESARYVISTQTLEIAVKTTGKVNATKVFVFENRTLSDVVTALKVAYNADIRIQNPEAANCTITIRFDDEDLDVALSVITETLGLSVEKLNGTYVIRGASCVH